MTVKKAGRKSNAEKAAEAAALELAKIETVDGVKVVTDLEPASEAPVSPSVDPIGEDLGDVSNAPAKTPVIASDEATGPVDPEAEMKSVLKATFTIEGGELPEVPGIEKAAARLAAEIDAEIIAEIEEKFGLTVVDDYKPILVPTMVGDARTGHIPCPKAVWELVQIEGWQTSIKDHPAHVQAGLKSVFYWQGVNGSAKVRCQSSSRFADAV